MPNAPNPISFLDLVARPLKGRLKIYIGAAAGVGKTYKMLEEGHQLRAKGIDVAIGLVETLGRAETAIPAISSRSSTTSIWPANSALVGKERNRRFLAEANDLDIKIVGDETLEESKL